MPEPAPTSGGPPPQHPLHHHRPAALRQPRLQRRHGGPHAGGRPPGRRGHQLPARLQPEHGVHAGALDHAHGPVRPHARRRGQRHPPARRRAVGGAVPARRGGLPHRAAGQGALRARLRPARTSSRRTRGSPAATPGRGAASSGPSRPCTRQPGATIPIAHYGRWLKEHHPEHLHSFAGLLQAEPGGDTAAPETKNNPIPREWYHTDWVADLTVDWLSSLGADEPWFCWMSFPDPHHPWDPPASELHRVPWQDLALPPGHPGSDEAVRAVLARKPAHWLGYWEGTFPNMEGGPGVLRALALDARPDPRGQRQGARHERAHRRGVRAGAAGDRRSGAGWPTPTSSSPPTTARCRATSGSSTRARTTPTR